MFTHYDTAKNKHKKYNNNLAAKCIEKKCLKSKPVLDSDTGQLLLTASRYKV